MVNPKRLYIIDTMAMAFRSHYAFGMRPLTTSDGQHVSAIFGAAMFLNKLIAEHRPDYLVAACDTKEPTFRHQLFPAYKANRSQMPEELAAQLPMFFQLLESMKIPMIRQGGIEADDIIGTLARQYASPDLHVYIVSGDKDFMQLVNDHVYLYQPKKGDESVIIDREGVRAKFGVLPEQVIDCLTIIGDTSDNVPGVHGIGEKGATKLLCNFGSIEGIYANLDKVTNKRQRTALEAARESYHLSRQLVTIKTDCELPLTIDDFVFAGESALANQALLDLYSRCEFRNLVTRTSDAMARLRSVEKAERAERAKQAEAKPKVKGAFVQGELFPSDTTDSFSFDDTESNDIEAAETPGIDCIETSPHNYILANDCEGLAAALASIQSAEMFCFDTETTGLSVVNDLPIGISLSAESGKAFYIPLVAKHLNGITPDQVKDAVTQILGNNDQLKIGHNLKFDLQMLQNAGIPVAGPFADTMIADYLLDANSRYHNLDACCLKYLNYEKIKTSTLIGENGEISMLSAKLENLATYACEDADLTLRLYRHMHEKLVETGLNQVFREVEMPLVPILGQMERRGIFIDREHLAELDVRLSEMVQTLEQRVYDLAGEEFNINSPKQLGNILFERMKIHEQLGLKYLKKTKSGFSTDESVLGKLAAHELPRTILEYRTVFKLKNTYVAALPELINTNSGRVHTSFHQTVTATGRLSSTEPNLQNIPIRSELGQSIREAFRPGEHNSVIISADYSQIELRMLAHLADEEALLTAFANKEDIHRLTAARIFGVAQEDVTSEMRARAKAINFGIIYGMGPRRLAADTGVTVAEASSFIDKYFEGYPRINTFITESIKKARDYGYCETITGRRRPLPELSYSGGRAAASAENIAVNTPIQGSAADLIKLAMIKVEESFRAAGLRSKMILQVHDELLFECPKDEIDEAVQIIKDSMETAMTLKVPLEVQIGIGSNWLEAH